MIEEIKTRVKENVKSTNHPGNQGHCEKTKPKEEIEKGEETAQRHRKCFQQIIEILSLKKELSIKVQTPSRTPNRRDQKIKFPWHIVIKTLNVQNK